MSKELEIYRANFLKGISAYQVDNPDLTDDKAVGEAIGISHLTIYKIRNKVQLPTVEQAINLCKKGGFNANWMLMNKGDMYLKKQNSLDDITKMLKEMQQALH